MTLSVIIPTKNRIFDLIETLKTVYKNSLKPDEIIIVDQSLEDSFEILKSVFKKGSLNIKYFYKPEINGLLEARDFGVKVSSNNILVFLDDDISLSEDFFEKLLECYMKYSVDGICAVDISEESTSILKVIARSIFWVGPFTDIRTILNKFHRYFKKPVKSDKFSAGYMSCKKEVYEDIKFDLSLKGHVFVGDIDFSYRASRKYNFVICPNLKVIHRQKVSNLYDLRQGEFKRVFARAYFFKKNIDKSLLNWLCFIWLMFGTLLGAIVRSISNWSLKPLYGFWDGVLKAIELLKEETK